MDKVKILGLPSNHKIDSIQRGKYISLAQKRLVAAYVFHTDFQPLSVQKAGELSNTPAGFVAGKDVLQNAIVVGVPVDIRIKPFRRKGLKFHEKDP